jgi:predicted dehydrogenase
MKANSPTSSGDLSRRSFLKTSTAATLAAPYIAGSGFAQESGTLRVGLVGCGGRGTGAAAQALAGDKNLKLVAMGDAFEDRIKGSLEALKKEAIAEKLDVSPERCFVGFDAYKRVIENSDVVLLATPPHFRPIHIKAAVDAGRHVFAEKPVAVDAPGVRAVLKACEEAKRKKLAVVSGLALRYSNGFRETVRRLHAGQAGDIVSLQINDYRGPIWVKPRQPGWTDMEYHMKNWYYFTWLSGDFNVEQHIHMLDVCAWIMKEQYPVSAVGTGGRAARTGPEYGNIYDHHAVIYEYANGVKLFAQCRQQAGTANEIAVHVMGSKGRAVLTSRGLEINGAEKWKFGEAMNNNFQVEHDELFGSIRRNEPINNGEYMSKSTLMAIMGRMATYTGQKVTWEQAMNSVEDLSPSGYDWDAHPPVSEVAIPGYTKLV